jgi:hypothetical protein
VFGKLFRWRKRAAAQYDESDVQAARTAMPRRTSAESTAKAIAPAKKAAGFDPYNSGAFHRQNAWERIPRR